MRTVKYIVGKWSKKKNLKRGKKEQKNFTTVLLQRVENFHGSNSQTNNFILRRQNGRQQESSMREVLRKMLEAQ